ncbi:Uncharacterized protein Adt_16784 [Abeliophyllum distichum]|uniref:Uncharacterized protein n=1 Tax=Abeliophyllum distichum TaxID=126358 RepID=A0ABD1TEN6_9LAMI
MFHRSALLWNKCFRYFMIVPMEDVDFTNSDGKTMNKLLKEATKSEAESAFSFSFSLGPVCVPLDLLVIEINSDHCLPETAADINQHLLVTIVRDGLDNGTGAAPRIATIGKFLLYILPYRMVDRN